MRALVGLTPATVSVWNGEGRGACYFGELIAVDMRERGCADGLLDGDIRDVGWLAEHGFPSTRATARRSNRSATGQRDRLRGAGHAARGHDRQSDDPSELFIEVAAIPGHPDAANAASEHGESTHPDRDAAG